MIRRPRILFVEGTGGHSIESLASTDQVDLVPAAGSHEALELLRAGAADAVLFDEMALGEQSEDAVTEELLKRLLEQISTGLAILDTKGLILWCNPEFVASCHRPVKRTERLGLNPTPPVSLVGKSLSEALSTGENPCDPCLVVQIPSPPKRMRRRITCQGNRHLEISLQPLRATGHPRQLGLDERNVEPPQEAGSLVLCVLRDVTTEVNEREKLTAIHRAGFELSHLTRDELEAMSTRERIDLLKANILQYSQNILKFKNLEVRLLDPQTLELRVLLTEGMTEIGANRRLYAEPEGNGVTGYVAATGTTYLCSDTAADPHYLPGARDARSSLTVPIKYRDRTIGVFNVESPSANHFTQRDAEFLEIFAREIGLALNTLDLLSAEKRLGATSSLQAVVSSVSLPVDEILADAIRMLDYLQQPLQNRDRAHEAVRRMLLNARGIKQALREAGSTLREEPVTPGRAASQEADHRWLNGKRALLVDADPEIRRSAHALLGRVGCELDTARSGAEGLTLLRTIPYDVVLGDIRLPDMNGYEFFCKVREHHSQMPVVLMTGFGYDAAHSMVRARQEGLRAALYKPFRLDRLCEAMQDALQGPNGAENGGALDGTKSPTPSVPIPTGTRLLPDDKQTLG